MFCPRCGAPNETDQGFCRQCGQSLSDVRLALAGGLASSLEKLKAGEKMVHGGAVTLAVFALIGLAIAIVSLVLTGPAYNVSIIVNLALALAVGLPLVLAGRANLRRAARTLADARDGSGRASLDEAGRPTEPLPAGLEADLQRLPACGSVTEETTLELKRSEPVSLKGERL